jgi:hypothetical protein
MTNIKHNGLALAKSSKDNISFLLERYKGSIESSNFFSYKKDPSKSSLKDLPTQVLNEIVLILNTGEYSVRKVSEHLGIDPRSISLFCKESGYVWSIAHRAFLSKKKYDLYKISNLKGNSSVSPSEEKKYKKYKNKKITINLSKVAANILEMRQCLQKKSRDTIISDLLLNSATSEERTLAENINITVRARVLVEDSTDLIEENY